MLIYTKILGQESLGFLYGRGERTQTFDLSVPNRARYQLRHTPISVHSCDYKLLDSVFLVARRALSVALRFGSRYY